MLYGFLIISIDYAITVVPFFPCYSPPSSTLIPSSIPPLSSCPWVLHISSLASPFSILFLTSPCLFCTYKLCFLFPVPFPSFSPSSSLLITLHVISISVILFLFSCLFSLFLFLFCSVVNSCKFIVILVFIVLIFFFLDKSL